jgi:mannose-6-phosphate isomerase-like protein (cupin superfamily)
MRYFQAIMELINRDDTIPFITKDGSEIRELLAYRNSSIRHQSLAEATLLPNTATTRHYHPKSEEIYYILKGSGIMEINGEKRTISVQDAIAIPPGQIHQLTNTGSESLILLCCCSPAYEHEDTILV